MENKEMAENLLSSLLNSKTSPTHHSGSLLEELLKPRQDQPEAPTEPQDYYSTLANMPSNMFPSIKNEVRGPLSMIGTTFDDDDEPSNSARPTSLLDLLLGVKPSSESSLTQPKLYPTIAHTLISSDRTLTVNLSHFHLDSLEYLEEHAVASLRRPAQFYPGTLVYANGYYIAYISKTGVRLIQQSNGLFTLLKHHSVPVCDIALSPSTGDDLVTTRMVTLYEDGYFVVEEVLPGEDDLKTKVLFKVQYSDTGFTRCIMSKDGKNALLVSPTVIFEFDLDNLPKLAEIASLADLNSLPGVVSYPNLAQDIVSADYSPYEHSFFVAGSHGAVSIVEGTHHGIGFSTGIDKHDKLSSITSGSAGNDLLIITGSKNNTILKIWDGDALKEVQEVKFVDRDDTAKFASYFYHPASCSLFASVNSAPILFRFVWTDKKFELVETFRLPSPALSINAEIYSMYEVDLFVVFESSISIFSIPVSDVKGYDVGEQYADLIDAKDGAAECDCVHEIEEDEDDGEEENEEIFTEELESEVARDIVNQMLDESVIKVSEELTLADSSCKSSESARENNFADLQEHAKSAKQKYPEDLRKHLPTQPVELRIPEGVLLSEPSKSSKQADVEKLIGFMVENQMETFESNIVEQVEESVDVIVGAHLKEFSLHLDKSLPLVIEKTVEQSVSKALEKSLKKTVEDQVAKAVEKALSKNTMADTMSRAVNVAVNASVSEVMSKSFEKVLIPAYQAATQVMFKQMQGAFQTGLNNVMGEFKVALSKHAESGGNRNISQDLLNKLNQQHEKQMKMISEIMNNLDVAVSNSKPVSPEDPRGKIAHLIEKGEFETAFIIAFESGNFQLVNFAVASTDLKQIFLIEGHPVLSQPALLTLIQHLVLDLNDSTETKFNWLQESLAALDTRHPLIAEYSKQVIPTVCIKLNEWTQQTTQTQPSNPHLLSAKLLSRYANSLILKQ